MSRDHENKIRDEKKGERVRTSMGRTKRCEPSVIRSCVGEEKRGSVPRSQERCSISPAVRVDLVKK